EDTGRAMRLGTALLEAPRSQPGNHQIGNEKELAAELLPLCLPPFRTTSLTVPTTLTLIGSHFFTRLPPSSLDSKHRPPASGGVLSQVVPLARHADQPAPRAADAIRSHAPGRFSRPSGNESS